MDEVETSWCWSLTGHSIFEMRMCGHHAAGETPASAKSTDWLYAASAACQAHFARVTHRIERWPHERAQNAHK